MEKLIEHLDIISQKVADITKSPEFTQEELHSGLANVKNDTKKVQTNQREIEDDLLNPTFVIEKLIDLGGTMIGSMTSQKYQTKPRKVAQKK